MTIKYLGGNRIQGTHKDRVVSSTDKSSTESHNYGCTLTTSNQVVGNGSVDFDGTSDALVFGNTDDWNFMHNGGSWTVAFWLIPDNYNTEDMIFNTNGTTNTNIGVQCIGLSNGDVRVRISDGKTGDLVTLTGADYRESTYNFIVITYNGSTLSMQRSNYQGSLSTAITSNNIAGKTFCKENSLNSLTLGAASDSHTTYPYDGKINTFMIWNRVLSSAEITALHNSGNGSKHIPPKDLKLQTCWYYTGESKSNAWYQNRAVAFHNIIFDETDTGKSYVAETYNIRKFTSSGTFTITDGSGEVDYLAIGGGGGGGTMYSTGGNSGGGGGAGAFREGSLYLSNASGSSGAHTVTVGAAGAGVVFAANGGNGHGGYGGDSVFDSITAEGGHGGATTMNGSMSAHTNTKNGSGGGGAAWSGTDTGAVGGAYGSKGGDSTAAGQGYAAAGGGGAGGAGKNDNSGDNASNNVPNTQYGGNGGDGKYSTITGVPILYAGGGGGGSYGGATLPSTGRAGGGHGGYPGSSSTRNGTNATANTGSGGGGAGNASGGGTGGNGGTGLVIIRYPKTMTATGGSLTTITKWTEIT